MPSASATAQACWPAAPPKGSNVNRAGSCPCLKARSRIAFAMRATATWRNSSARFSIPRFGPIVPVQVGGNPGEAKTRRLDVERLVARRAEHGREALRPDASEHDVAVGDGRGSAAPVAGRPRVGARRFRAHLQSSVGKSHDRPAACGDRMDVHHRDPEPDAVDLGREPARQLASEETDVGRRAAHVEADEPARPARVSHGCQPDHATCRTGQHAVDATKAIRVDEAAIALHQQQLGRAVALRQFAQELPHVAQQHRRQVGIRDGAVAAGDEARQRRDFVRGDHLLEAGGDGKRGRAQFVLRIAHAMQEGDRHRAQAARAGRRRVRAAATLRREA